MAHTKSFSSSMALLVSILSPHFLGTLHLMTGRSGLNLANSIWRLQKHLNCPKDTVRTEAQNGSERSRTIYESEVVGSRLRNVECRYYGRLLTSPLCDELSDKSINNGSALRTGHWH